MIHDENNIPLTLLYVEDCDQIREINSLIFQEYFSTIILAVNGEDGLDKFKKNQIDIIITDLLMPKLNGMEMIEKIRAINSNVPILITSALTDIEKLRESIQYNISDYLFKPLERKAFKEILNKIKQKAIDQKRKTYLLEQANLIHPKKQFYHFTEKFNNLMVVLIKIEDFHYIEGYHHQQLTEAMQRDFALKIISQIPKKCAFSKIYILGDGEFALAKEINNINNEDVIATIKKFQKEINQSKINMGYIDYNLSIIISLAYGKEALTDAQIGLKKLLKEKENFIVANGLSIKNQKHSINKIETFNIIKRAIDSSNIISYFQPIIHNQTKQIVKYESLVRLINEKGDVLTPHLFLNISKEGTYYTQITSIVLEQSFKALQKTNKQISINLSALDIEREETRLEFIQKLQANLFDVKRIVLEFTEDENIHNIHLVKAFIKEVKELGVTIAIDDFGVGYSGFERVLDYQPDILKIDGRLIKNINKDKVAYSIVESIVRFAQKEHLETIAEYVESESIYTTLCDLGVDYSQGYYFGKPAIL